MKRAALFTSIIALALTGIACNKGEGGFSQRAKAGAAGVFRYPIVTNPTSLDPAVVQDGDTLDLLQNVYEGLVAWDENSRVVPALAERWEVSPDGRTYTFFLKKGVKFHNGRKVTADDFKYSIERACDPALKSSTPETYLYDIVGARAKHKGEAQSVDGVKVVDPYTLAITIDEPRAYFLGKLTFAVSYPVAKEVAKMGSEIKTLEEAVGTGPYKFEKVENEQIFILAANPDYHGGKPPIEKIERPVIKDAATRLSKYKNGELDLVMLERMDVPSLQNDPAFKDHLKFYNRPSLWYVGMNTKIYPPFGNPKVRRAVAMAIDKNNIVNDVLGGINTVANSIVPPGVMGHRENVQGVPYDPEGARKLLAEAGYPDGKGLPPIDLNYRADRPDIRLVAEAVASQLKKNLNMSVNQRQSEWRAFLDKNNAKEQPFVHMRWAADYLDPQNFLSLLLATDGGENKLNYSNPQFDALTKEADTTQDEAKRLELYAQAEDMVLQDGTIIPIYFQRDAELINPRVKGLRESLFGHLPHTAVRLEG